MKRFLIPIGSLFFLTTPALAQQQAVTELMPLPELDFSAWTLALPLCGLALLAANVAWRSTGGKPKKKR